MWGEELTCKEDVFHVFHCFITSHKNKNGVKVHDLWTQLQLVKLTLQRCLSFWWGGRVRSVILVGWEGAFSDSGGVGGCVQ